MELFGLHNKDGREYKLIENGVYWNASPVKPEAESEFKVGDWIISVDKTEHLWDSYDETYGLPPFKPERIISFDPYAVYTEECKDKGYIKQDANNRYLLRHATSQEIESHLREICDEKGYKKGVKIKDMETGVVTTLTNSMDWFYSETADSFHGSVLQSEWEKNCSNPRIYAHGKWAEIISEKKPLPKTKKELIDIISEWDIRGGNLDDFLKDYED